MCPCQGVSVTRSAIFGLVLISIACGGVQGPEAPAPGEPAPTVTGGGSVAASDGTSIAYTVFGTGAPALVFIHGWMCNQTFWDAQVSPMSESHTVVTIDLAGHGLSEMNRDAWTMTSFGADVQTVVEHLGLEEVILVGHSMGAPVALEAARLMPDRVIGVIAVDALQNADFQVDPTRAAELLALWEEDFAGSCTSFVTSMFPESADPWLVDRVETSMCAATPESSIAQLRAFFRYDLKTALEAIHVPVRCINSANWPTNVEGNRAYHEDFDAIIIDGPGHFLMMEEPDEFNKLLAPTIVDLEKQSE